MTPILRPEPRLYFIKAIIAAEETTSEVVNPDGGVLIQVMTEDDDFAGASISFQGLFDKPINREGALIEVDLNTDDISTVDPAIAYTLGDRFKVVSDTEQPEDTPTTLRLIFRAP